MAINVATWDGTTLTVSVSPTPPPGFALLTASDYRHGEAVTLTVTGADGSYSVRWSPSGADKNASGSVALTVTGDALDVNGDGTITVTGARGIVRYLETGYIWLSQDADEASLAKTLLLEDGKQAVTLTTVDQLDGAFRITAIPDLDVGDQVIWWDIQPSGDVVVLEDASFNCSQDVESFKVEAHVAGEGYSASPATQYPAQHELEADGITAGAPVVYLPFLDQGEGFVNLTAFGIVSGVAVVGSPEAQDLGLSADSVRARPVIGVPSLRKTGEPPAIVLSGSRLSRLANLQAVQKPAVRMATFVFIDIPGDPVRANTSAIDVVTGGHTWTGTGSLGGVELVSEDVNIIGAPVRLTLSGIPSDLLTNIQTADFRNRAVEISLGFFSQDWKLLADLEPLWSGVADHAQLSVSEGSAAVSLTCENALAALIGRPLPIRYTDQEQQRRFEGDNFFRLLPMMFNLQLEWGGVRLGTGGTGGMGTRDPNPWDADRRLH